MSHFDKTWPPLIHTWGGAWSQPGFGNRVSKQVSQTFACPNCDTKFTLLNNEMNPIYTDFAFLDQLLLHEVNCARICCKFTIFEWFYLRAIEVNYHQLKSKRVIMLKDCIKRSFEDFMKQCYARICSLYLNGAIQIKGIYSRVIYCKSLKK